MLPLVTEAPEPNYSMAARRYLANTGDIGVLLGLHEMIGGSKPGRRRNVDVLNRAGIVLLCAFWEAFCEDLADEALRQLLKNAGSPEALPEPLRKVIANEIKLDKNELSPWRLAGDGWRKLLTDRAETMRVERNRALNTPKADEIRRLFATTIGLSDVTSYWHWKNTTAAQARARLDRYVTLRGDIAHRGASHAQPIWKKDVQDFATHVTRLVAYTEGPVTQFLAAHRNVAVPPVPLLTSHPKDRLAAMKRALRVSPVP